MELSIVLSLTFNRAFGFSVGACRCDFLPFPNLSGPFRYLFTFASYYFSISVRPLFSDVSEAKWGPNNA